MQEIQNNQKRLEKYNKLGRLPNFKTYNKVSVNLSAYLKMDKRHKSKS